MDVLAYQIFWSKVQYFATLFILEFLEDCHFNYCLAATSGWRSYKDRVSAMVNLIKNLSLNCVEFSYAIFMVHLLHICKLQIFHKFWVHVLKRSWRREPVWQNKMFEWDWERSLCMHPSIRNNFNKILGWHWFMKPNSKTKSMILMTCLLFEDELLQVKNRLAVAIMNQNPERLRCPMVLWVPSKILMCFQVKFYS